MVCLVFVLCVDLVGGPAAGATEVAEAFMANNKIQTLNLAVNGIGPVGVAK